MCGQSLNNDQQVLDPTVNIRLVRVCSRSQQVRHLRLIILLNEVPGLPVGSPLVDELALGVFLFKLLCQLIFVFFVLLLAAGGYHHGLAGPALAQVIGDCSLDGLGLELAAISSESFEHDVVLDDLHDLVIDAAEGCSAGQPETFVFLVVFVVVLPDPSPLFYNKNRRWLARVLFF